jgi:hypothetical protein
MTTTATKPAAAKKTGRHAKPMSWYDRIVDARYRGVYSTPAEWGTHRVMTHPEAVRYFLYRLGRIKAIATIRETR